MDFLLGMSQVERSMGYIERRQTNPKANRLIWMVDVGIFLQFFLVIPNGKATDNPCFLDKPSGLFESVPHALLTFVGPLGTSSRNFTGNQTRWCWIIWVMCVVHCAVDAKDWSRYLFNSNSILSASEWFLSVYEYHWIAKGWQGVCLGKWGSGLNS